MPESPFSQSPYKEAKRRALARQLQEYLDAGGDITRVAPGVSGHQDALRPPPATHFTSGPRASRTPVPEVVAAIEQRRMRARKPATVKQRTRPQRRLLYDDFGEPLRWEWVIAPRSATTSSSASTSAPSTTADPQSKPSSRSRS